MPIRTPTLVYKGHRALCKNQTFQHSNCNLSKMPTHEEFVDEDKQMFRQKFLNDPDTQAIVFKVLDTIEGMDDPVEALTWFMDIVWTYVCDPSLQGINKEISLLLDEVSEVHERYRPSALMAAIMIVKAFKEVPPPLPTPCNSEDDE